MRKNSLETILPFLRGKQPGFEEIEGLVDLLPQASLLIDLESRRILLANAKATELTAFTRAELTELGLETLFPGALVDSFLKDSAGGNFTTKSMIITHNGTRLEVYATLTRLSRTSHWALASLEPVSSLQQQMAERQRQDVRLRDLYALAVSSHEEETDRAIGAAFQSAANLTGAALIALYLVNDQAPGLHRAMGLGEIEKFPEHIPPSDIEALIEPSLWAPGIRAGTALQRAARAANLAYLASAPLGESGAISGLIAIASPDSAVPDDAIPQIRIIAATLTAILQHHIRTANLLEERKRQSHQVAIGETIKEASYEGVILANPELAIVEMNASAEQLLGYASREVKGQPIDHVLIGAENLAPALQAAQQGIPTANLGSVRLHRRDGVAFLAHVRILPVTISDRLEGIIILLRDLSEHEQFQIRNQTLEQRAVLGEITAIFAHEVRNPINNISTGLQLMAMNLPPDDPNQEAIARLNQDCNRLTHLMNTVLSFSKPAESKIEQIDLGLLITRLLDLWRPRMARVNIQYQISISSKNLLITGDPRSLEQVFTNLISNAVQAMSKTGGSLAVNVRPFILPDERPQIEVTVADNGPGIPEEARERIFEPFFTTNRNGTGLGLAIAKRIITAHKGAIHVSSVPGGTVFQVILPAEEETA